MREVTCSDGGKIYIPTPRCDKLMTHGTKAQWIALALKLEGENSLLRVAGNAVVASIPTNVQKQYE